MWSNVQGTSSPSDKTDACPKEAGSNKHGVQLDSNLKFQLSVGVDGFLGEGDGNPLLNKELLVRDETPTHRRP